MKAAPMDAHHWVQFYNSKVSCFRNVEECSKIRRVSNYKEAIVIHAIVGFLFYEWNWAIPFHLAAIGMKYKYLAIYPVGCR